MMSIILPDYNEPNLELVKREISTLFPDAEVIVISDTQGKGKGWAIREGFSRASGGIIVFLDADMDIHPRMINRLLPFLEDYDVVVGTKRIEEGLLSRKILTFLSRIYIRILFGISVDTQTGIKLFKRWTIRPWKTNGYAFDIEILYHAKKLKCRMIEVPIDANIKRRMSWKPILKTLKESIKLRWFL